MFDLHTTIKKQNSLPLSMPYPWSKTCQSTKDGFVQTLLSHI